MEKQFYGRFQNYDRFIKIEDNKPVYDMDEVGKHVNTLQYSFQKDKFYAQLREYFEGVRVKLAGEVYGS